MHPHSRLIAVAALASVSLADSCGGGQLVSENQFTTLLDHAPTCFKAGCGGNLTSMSSSCAADSPCYDLWTFLRPSWQEQNEWCKDCASDKACWIPGWAVFNATQICNTSPNISLFSNVGSCCASGNGPIEFSEWLGSMCDDLEWRTRYFQSSYGMHPIDWYDRLRAINYTLRAPNRNATVGYCDADSSSAATLRALGIQNLIDFAETLFEIIFFWALIIWGTKWGRKKLKNWKHAFIEGVISGLMAVLGNLVTVLVWVFVMRYHDDRYAKAKYVEELFFTLCVRPSIVGYLCFLVLLTRPLEKRMTRFGHYLAKTILPVQRWWQKTLVALRLRKQRRPRPTSRDSDELDTINVNKARQFLANWAFIIAFAELFMQALSFPAVFWTVDAGRKRSFYSGVLQGHYLLVPQARLWYTGGMLHIIFWIPSVFMLLASSYVHLNRSKVQEWLATQGLIRYLFDQLDRYYRRRRILEEEEDQLTGTWQSHDHRRAARQQGVLRTLLLAMTRRGNSGGESAPMLQRNSRDSTSLESTEGSPRMSWVRRAFLNLRIGAVTRLLGRNAPPNDLREKDGVRPATPTETTALRSTSNASQPGRDPFADPSGPPEMTTALGGHSNRRASTTNTDMENATLSPYSETSHYYNHPNIPESEPVEDLSYRGYYSPTHDPPSSSPPSAATRWHRPETLAGSSVIDDANYSAGGDFAAGPYQSYHLGDDSPHPQPPTTFIPHGQDLQDPAPGGPPPLPTGPNKLRKFHRRRRLGRKYSRAPPFRLSGYILSHWPFRTLVHSLYIWLSEARQQQLLLAERQRTAVHGPDEEEFEELKKVARDMKASGLPGWRRIALWGTFLTVTVNYVSQWLWWAGFVQVLGDRWCPPDFDFKLEKGIWAAGNFMLVLVSLGFAMFGSGEQ